MRAYTHAEVLFNLIPPKYSTIKKDTQVELNICVTL